MIRQTLSKLVGDPDQLQAYVWLICEADQDGIVRELSRRRMAAVCGATLRQVRRLLETLSRRGFIAISGAPRARQDVVILPRSGPDPAQLSPTKTIDSGGLLPRSGPDPAHKCAGAAIVVDPNGPDPAQVSPIKTTNKKDIRPRSGSDPRESLLNTKKKKYLGSAFWDLSVAYVEDSKKRVPAATKSLNENAVANGAEALDQLVRLEGYDLETEIKPTLRWARKDPFWSRNLLSLGSLRKRGSDGLMKYEQIRARMEADIQEQEHPGAKEVIPASTGCTIDEWRAKTGGRNSIRL